MLKTWDGWLVDLNKEEMALFSWFHNQLEFGVHSSSYITYKKDIKERVNNWKKAKWPSKVINICEFMLYERLERHRKAQVKWEKQQYRKLKRKYAL